MMDSVSIFFYNVLQCDKLPSLDEDLCEETDFINLDNVIEHQRKH